MQSCAGMQPVYMAGSKAAGGSLIRDLTEGSVPRALIAFALPLFFSNLLQIAYNMADMLVVGRFCGSTGLSAVSIGGDIQGFMTFVAMGFSGAGQVIISQMLGAGEKKKLGCFIGTMFAFLLPCALALSGMCFLLRTPILRWMNTPQAAWADTMAYASVCMAGLVFVYGYNAVSAVLRGMGDSRHPFLFIGLAAVLNVGLDLWFVAGLGWGPFGAALATVLSQTVSFISAVLFLWRHRTSLGFSVTRADLRIDPAMLAALSRLGVPMAITGAAVSFSKLFVNSWVNSYGVAVSAVSGIGSKFGSVSNLVSNAMNTAGATMIGQCIGAEKYGRVPRVVSTAFAINGSVSALFIALILLWPAQLFGLFTADAAVLNAAAAYVPVAVLVFAGSACRGSLNALISGSGNYHINFAVAILDGIVIRIGLALLLGLWLDMAYVGFWLGDALSSFTPAVIGLWYLCSGRWKTRRYLPRNS